MNLSLGVSASCSQTASCLAAPHSLHLHVIAPAPGGSASNSHLPNIIPARFKVAGSSNITLGRENGAVG